MRGVLHSRGSLLTENSMQSHPLQIWRYYITLSAYLPRVCNLRVDIEIYHLSKGVAERNRKACPERFSMQSAELVFVAVGLD